MALADLDNDGDLDVVVNVLSGPLLMYRNDCAGPRIVVRLRGKGANTFGIGAKITLKGGPVTQTQEMICGGRYLSGDDAARTFAAGTTVEVKWRSGVVNIVSNVEPNHVYEIHEDRVPPLASPNQPLKDVTPFFADVSDLLKEMNVPEVVNTFSRSTFTNIAGFTGWWNCIVKADFNNDGRMDIVAGNWGRNTKFQHYSKRPLHAFHGDVDGDGTVEIVDAFEEPGTGKLRPWRGLDVMSRAMPWLVERFPTYAAYGRADIDEILGETKAKMKHFQVNTLDSMIFLQHGDGFEARTLPIEAQFSPVLAICVADFDRDGKLDLFLAQNFFGTDPDTSCYDAGQGLLLRGDGRGSFMAVSAKESGIAIYGEQRGCVVCDFDRDGGMDLAVTQHGGPTKLFRNQVPKN